LKNFKLTIAYDGTNYFGWQIQPNHTTVQGLIKEKLEIFLQEEIKLIGASRTDAGVHAKSQVANFLTNKKISQNEIFN
jgi:tRNA pseudouridine38-40 synthase